MQFIYGTNRAMHFYIKKKQTKNKQTAFGKSVSKSAKFKRGIVLLIFVSDVSHCHSIVIATDNLFSAFSKRFVIRAPGR